MTTHYMMSWVNLVMRSFHIAASVMWIGHLWFLSFVNTKLTRSLDEGAKKSVLPEPTPRTLYWFRWGALFTSVSGIVLLRSVYYSGGIVLPPQSSLSVSLVNAIGMGTIFVGFRVYDLSWRLLRRVPRIAAAVYFSLIVGVATGLARIFTGQAALIHVSAMLGVAMAMNDWLRIWPSQRVLIAAAAKGAPLPEDAVATATERWKHNAYLSLPALLLMMSIHYPALLYGLSTDVVVVPLVVAGFVAAGWLAAQILFVKSEQNNAARFQPSRE